MTRTEKIGITVIIFSICLVIIAVVFGFPADITAKIVGVLFVSGGLILFLPLIWRE